jgi:hypothetical protein
VRSSLSRSSRAVLAVLLLAIGSTCTDRAGGAFCEAAMAVRDAPSGDREKPAAQEVGRAYGRLARAAPRGHEASFAYLERLWLARAEAVSAEDPLEGGAALQRVEEQFPDEEAHAERAASEIEERCDIRL